LATQTNIINVSPLATQKFGEVLAEQNEEGSFVRIIAVPGQHGGVQYMLSLEKDAKEEDVVIDADSVKFLVDSESRPLVEGSSIDYVDGLMRAGFTISNPNFQQAGGGCACGGQCGCGGGGGGHGH